MLNSIRFRLLAGTILGTLVVYVASAAVLYGAIRQSLLSEFDGGLLTKANVLSGLTEQTDRGLRIEPEVGQPTYGDGRSDEGFVLLAEDGRALAKSEPLGRRAWWKSVPLRADDRRYFGFLSEPDLRARYVVTRYTPRRIDSDRDERPVVSPPAKPVTLIVLGNPHEMNEKLQNLLALLIGSFALATLVSAGILALVIRGGLRPLGALAGELQGIGGDDLQKRVEVGRPPSEIQPVVERLNELLERLDASFSRERAFTADVAHEMRTPLAGLTTALEVSALRPREAAEYQQTIQGCLAASRSMRSMVENLLTLARADARQLNAGRKNVDLSGLMQRAWEPFAARAAGRNLQVVWSLDENAGMQTDAGLLSMVVTNLFDNAVSYIDDGGKLQIELHKNDAATVMRIANSGSEIAAEDTAKVFERFWRADLSRTGSGQHFGLGLALCQRITTLLGGEISVQSQRGGVFEVTLRFV